MLPVAKKPVIQYIVEDLVDASIKEILIITGKNKRAIDDHFDKDPILLEDLKKRNKVAQICDLEALENLSVQIFYVRQAVTTGLADAVYLAKKFVNGEDFVVTLGDTIIDSQQNPNHLLRLINFHKETQALCTLSAERIPIEHCNRYGIMSIKEYNGLISSKNHTGKYIVEDLVEKPSIEEAPSNLAICGRYVFKTRIFDYIEKIGFGKGGEKQLTDAIRLSRENNKIVALELQNNEIRFDTGTFPLYAKAFVEFCLKDEEIGPELKAHLKKILL